MLILVLFICVGMFIFFVIQLLTDFVVDAPFVPIPNGIDAVIIENLNLNSNSTLFDLGCGDGRVLIDASRKFPTIEAIGVEIAYFPYLMAKFKSRNYRNIKILRRNIFQTDISSASHIFLYLCPEILDRLLPIIKKECRPGTTIVSCDFKFKDLEPKKVVDTGIKNSLRGKKILVYKV